MSKQDVYLLQRTAAARRQLAEVQAKGDGAKEVLTSAYLPENKAARRAHNPEVTGSNPGPVT